MTKLMTAAGVAVLGLSFAALGYAAQGQTDAGGVSGQVSPSTPDATSPKTSPNMAGDRGSQRDTDSGATKQSKRKGKSSSESSLGLDKDQNTGSSSKAGKAPPAGGEGSNPSLDKTGKGSAPGG
jgi:hypothetical protein